MKPISCAVLVILSLTSFINADNQHYRLPLSVRPTTYVLKLHPVIDEDIFKGEVIIFVKVQQNLDKITLHSKNLTISRIILDEEDISELYDLDEEYNLLNIYRPHKQVIFPGEHIITIRFSGDLITDPHAEYGLRKVVYERTDGTEGYLVVSDLEATYARLIYPCFDEPHFKAKFNIRLITPNETYVALSNMKSIATYETQDGIIYDFQQTVLMSTYLTTFVITDFPFSETVWVNNGVKVPIRFYSPFAKIEENQVVLKTAIDSLEYFTKYTQIAYPLPKLDMIEFSRNVVATEDWGIITFQDGFLSPSQGKVTEFELKLVILHEICHFWFGNLVTNYWWNDIWLHEGFAEYMSEQAFDKLYPGSNVTRDSTSSLEYVFIEDLQGHPKSVVQQLSNDTEIENHFDDVTYYKGSAILRQIESLMGSEKFQLALQKYLTKFAYSTATTGDLINIFEEVSNNVYLRKFVLSWAYQRGHPIILVEEDEGNDEFVLKQQYLQSKTKKNRVKNTRQKWTIPITYYTSEDRTPKVVWFDEELEEVRIPRENVTWVNFNSEEIGIYRVNYTQNLLKAFRENFDDLESEEQESILRNVHDLFVNNFVTCNTLLDLYYKRNSGPGDILFAGMTLRRMIQPYLYNYDEEALESYTKFTFNRKDDDEQKPDVLLGKKVEDSIKGVKDFYEEAKKVISEDQSKCCAEWVKKNIMIDIPAINNVIPDVEDNDV